MASRTWWTGRKRRGRWGEKAGYPKAGAYLSRLANVRQTSNSVTHPTLLPISPNHTNLTTTPLLPSEGVSSECIFLK